MMYANRTGKSSLMNDEPAWADLEVPDAAGFFGFTSSALVHATTWATFLGNSVVRRPANF